MNGESKAPIWTFVGMIVVFKIVTSVIIYLHDPTPFNGWFQIAMNWYWPVLVIGLLAVPGAYWFRLIRARRRRRALIRSEWCVDAERDWNPADSRGKIRQP